MQPSPDGLPHPIPVGLFRTGKIERGVAAPLFETAKKIAVALDVPAPFLFSANTVPGAGQRARLVTEIKSTLSRMNDDQLGRAAKMLKAFVG